MSSHGKGISGGDRIYIEFARNWSKKNPVEIVLWEEGFQMAQRQKLKSKDITFTLLKMNNFPKLGFLANYIARIVRSVVFSVIHKLSKDAIIYSSSEFLMDTLPAVMFKIRYPSIKWVATWYQTAPSPFRGFSESKREKSYRFNALLYWASQAIIKPFIVHYADYVLVNNEIEKKQFPKLKSKKRVIVVIGAVPLTSIQSWMKKNKITKKIYDGVFQGRFHAQKGVVELVEIWKKVVNKKPNAKLAMIGDGPLVKDVKSKIKKLKLSNNIKLFGFLFDGDRKYRIFSQSKIVLHPAFFDSGGMASAEAMAFGLPAIGFDLKAYRSYYPKGIVRIKKGSLDGFSEEILNLLDNEKRRDEIGKEARIMIEKNWSWEKRATEIYNQVIKE